MHQPVIRALEVIKQSAERAPRFYDPEEIPLDGVVRSGWRETVEVADKQGRVRVDLRRVNYFCRRLASPETDTRFLPVLPQH
jgi:hypothetical protein